MRGAVIGLLVATAFILSGCQYLLGGMMGGPVILPGGSFDPGDFGSFDPGEFDSFDPNDPAFSMPPPTATYSKGSASVIIDGKTTVLGKLNGTAGIYPNLGTNVSWTDGAGMYLQFFNDPVSGLSDGFVVLDRIADNKHATIADPSVCKVALTKSDPQGLSGSATCTGARWADAISSPLGPNLIDGEPAFDAKISFEAAP